MKLRKVVTSMIHSKTELQKIWCGYCVLNIFMLFPGRLMMLIYETALDMPWFLGWLLPFMAFYPVIWYYWKLNYLHIVAGFGFIIFSVYMLVKEKNIRLFLLTIILTVLTSALNLSWIILGLEW